MAADGQVEGRKEELSLCEVRDIPKGQGSDWITGVSLGWEVV